MTIGKASGLDGQAAKMSFARLKGRKAAYRLIFVPAKPVRTHPNSPATTAIKSLVNADQQRLQVFQTLQNYDQTDPPSIALSVISRATAKQLRRLSLLPLQALPPVEADPVPVFESKSLESTDEDVIDPPLPPELQPVLMDDGFPKLPEGEKLVPFASDGFVFDADSIDLKNMPDFDPDEDLEAEYYTDDVYAWTKSNNLDLVQGARPRLYNCLHVPKKRPTT
ncbi:MAG: hypothetical protein Q9222_003379 [Ikaeria aurantiellina]